MQTRGSPLDLRPGKPQAASRKRRGSCSPDLEDAPGMHRYSVRSTGRSFIIVSLCFGASS